MGEMGCCWFAASGISWVKSETGSHTEGKVRQRKRHTTHIGREQLISKRTYI